MIEEKMKRKQGVMEWEKSKSISLKNYMKYKFGRKKNCYRYHNYSPSSNILFFQPLLVINEHIFKYLRYNEIVNYINS